MDASRYILQTLRRVEAFIVPNIGVIGHLGSNWIITDWCCLALAYSRGEVIRCRKFLKANFTWWQRNIANPHLWKGLKILRGPIESYSRPFAFEQDQYFEKQLVFVVPEQKEKLIRQFTLMNACMRGDFQKLDDAITDPSIYYIWIKEDDMRLTEVLTVAAATAYLKGQPEKCHQYMENSRYVNGGEIPLPEALKLGLYLLGFVPTPGAVFPDF